MMKMYIHVVILFEIKIRRKRLTADLLVHSEVNANELGFSGLSPKILFYKRVK